MKALFSFIILLLCITTKAQQAKLFFDSTARYTQFVSVQNTSNNTSITNSIAYWLLQHEQALQLKALPQQQYTDSITLSGKMPIIDSTGIFSNVFCLFKLQIIIQDEGYAIQWKDLQFEKNGKTSSVADLYNGCKQQQPLQRTIYESKKNALARHAYLLSCLEQKLLQVNNSLKEQVLHQTTNVQKLAAK